MSEVAQQYEEQSTEDAGEEEPQAAEATEEGRYIPYSGGIMGWFENSGVLKSELPNNYLFYTALDDEQVRITQFQRWGERFNRRGDRRRVRRETEVELRWGEHTVRGTTRDISTHGVRLQLTQAVPLTKGARVNTALLEPGTGEVMADAPGTVVWFEHIGKVRAVWQAGISFGPLDEESRQRLSAFLER